jgi:hypothetical protein
MQLGTRVAAVLETEDPMSVVRRLGTQTLPCGCIVGQYREVHTQRSVMYIEEKAPACLAPSHRQNHTVAGARLHPPSAAFPIREGIR